MERKLAVIVEPSGEFWELLSYSSIEGRNFREDWYIARETMHSMESLPEGYGRLDHLEFLVNIMNENGWDIDIVEHHVRVSI